MNINWKPFAVSLFALLAFMSMRTEAHAASVQVRVGVSSPMGDLKGIVQQAGIDMFIYEGRRVELFAGAELIKSGSEGLTNTNTQSVLSKIPYSLNIAAATFGLRLKPALSGRWRPYLALGGIAGRAEYEVDASGLTDAVLLSTESGSRNFVSPRLGLGIDLGLGEQWSLGLELTYTGSARFLNVVIADYNTGRIEDVKLNDGADMFGAALGLRYAF